MRAEAAERPIVGRKKLAGHRVSKARGRGGGPKLGTPVLLPELPGQESARGLTPQFSPEASA